MEEFRALGYFPYVHIYLREECIGAFDDRMYMGHDKAVSQWKGLGVNLASADDEAPLQVGFLRNLKGRFKGARNSHFLGRAETAGHNYIDSLRKRAANGLKGLAAHDHRAAEGGALEELEIFGDVPQKLVIASDGIIVRDRYYYAFFHNLIL